MKPDWRDPLPYKAMRDWPREWMAWELLRRRGDYRSAYSDDDPTRWHLSEMLDPERDAAAHRHIPWRLGQFRHRVQPVRSGKSYIFDGANNPRLPNSSFRRWEALTFDLCQPLGPQLDQAREMLERMRSEAPTPTAGRSEANLAGYLRVLDARAEKTAWSAIAETIGGTVDGAKKLGGRAKKAQDGYAKIAAALPE